MNNIYYKVKEYDDTELRDLIATKLSQSELNNLKSEIDVSHLITPSITHTTNLINNKGQLGRHISLTNTSSITITVDSANGFIATYMMTGTGNVTFLAGAGKSLVQVDNTNVLNKLGATATVSVVDTKVFLRISIPV